MSKKILISGLVGALVFTGVGFGTESTGSRFLGPVEVNASEVTSPVLSDTQAKFDSLFTQDLAISKEIELLRLNNLSNEYSTRNVTEVNSLVGNRIRSYEKSASDYGKRLSATRAEEKKLVAEFTKAKAELTALKKREVVLATSKKAADVKELASVRKSIGSVNVKIDTLRSKLHLNSVAQYNESELFNKFSHEAAALKSVTVQAASREASESRVTASNRSKLVSLDTKKRAVSKSLEELRAPVAKESIEKIILRLNGTKDVKTTADLKKDLEVVEGLLTTRNGMLVKLRVYGSESLLEYAKVNNEVGKLSERIGHTKLERGLTEMSISLTTARIKHFEDMISSDKRQINYLETRLASMNSEVNKLSKSSKAADKDRVIELKKDIRNANHLLSHVRHDFLEDDRAQEISKLKDYKVRLAKVNSELIALEKQKSGLKDRMDRAVTNKLAADARVVNEQGYINEIIKYRDALKAKIGK